MKSKYLSIIGVLGLVLLFVTACDKIEEPYLVEVPPVTVTPIYDTVVPDNAIRNILFEDFTGHGCVNCPEAHKVLEDLHEKYGSRLVTMVIHTGFFSWPVEPPFDYDFRTPEGTLIAETFAAKGAALPKGMIDRDGELIGVAAYEAEVSRVLDNPALEYPDVYIEIADASFDAGARTIDVNVKAIATKDFPAGQYNLAVYVTESGIVKPQKNSNPDMGTTPVIEDYEHNEVLRGAIYSAWGNIVTTDAIAKNDGFSVSYSDFKIGDDWNPDHLHLVAVFFKMGGSNDKEIIQAVQIDL